MSRRAYLYAREMVWNKAAESYMSTFVRARSDRIASTAYRVLESVYLKSSHRLSHSHHVTGRPEFLQHEQFRQRSIHFLAQDKIVGASTVIEWGTAWMWRRTSPI